jgi:hypothetical protein
VLNTKEAEQTAASTEAGKYERKSVSFINALWLMDKSVRGMPAEYASYTLDKIKQKLMMPRFDYNPLPQALISDFVAKANAQEEITIDNLAALMDETIVPKILQVVDLEKELRAQNYTSEAQRNSFYAAKAKEYGFTDVEIAKVMNSAFIFIPVAKSYLGLSKDGQYTMKMDVGVIWYRISTKGEKAQAKMVVKKITTSMGFSKEKNAAGLPKTYVYDGKAVDFKEFAFRACVKNAARNLLVATQEMPEFRLSSQVIEVDGGKVGFPLGKTEGLTTDDKYRIVEFEEDANGNVKQANNGWVLVTNVADSNSKEGYKSKARTIAGAPMQGVILSEYPRIPIDILFKAKRFAYSQATDNYNQGSYIDSLDCSGGMGFQLDAHYNIGRYLNVNQLYAGVGFGMGWGSAKGTAWTVNGATKIKGVTNANWEFSLLKKFYISRLAIVLQPVFGLQGVSVDAGSLDFLGTTYYYRFTNAGGGFELNGGLEYALSPAVNLGLTAGYQMYGESNDWSFEGKSGVSGSWSGIPLTGSNEVKLKHSGLAIQLYLTFSPPSLPFDPWDMIRGRLGI